MSMAASLLALVVLGADSAPTAPGVAYELRVVEMRGLDWRGEFHDRLERVCRQGGATVWTAPREVAECIVGQAEVTIAAPKVSAFAGEPTAVQTGCRKAYVAELERVANGPVGQATLVAYKPEIEQAEDSVAVSLTGRAIDQGVLAEVEIDESRVVAVASYKIYENVKEETSTGPKLTHLAATVQVPEIIQTSVGGEWLIPSGGALIVSLGVHTSVDEDGLAVPRERLAVIEAKPLGAAGLPGDMDELPPLPIGPSNLPAPVVAGQTVACWIAPPTAVAVPISALDSTPARLAVLPTPEPPARVLPTPINHLGEVVPLPPLPEPEPLAEPSAEPRPAPQTRVPARPAPVPAPPAVTVPEAPAPKSVPGDAAPEAPEEDLAGLAPRRSTTGRLQIQLAGGRLSVQGELSRKVAPQARVAEVEEVADDAHTGCVAGKCCGGPGCEHGDKEIVRAAAESDPVRMCPQAEATAATPTPLYHGILHAGIWINPTLRPAPKPVTAEADQPEIWALSLDDAVRISLENSEVARVKAEPTCDGTPALVVSRVRPDLTPWSFAASVADLVRSVVQQYHDLAEAQVRYWSAETAVDLCEQILKREQASSSRDRTNLAEAEEQLARFRLNAIQATADLTRSERSLRHVLGLPPADSRRIVPTTAPGREAVALNWADCVETMNANNLKIRAHREILLGTAAALLPSVPGLFEVSASLSNSVTWDDLRRQSEVALQAEQQAKHELARAYLEVENGLKLVETAEHLKAAALKRLEAQKAFYEERAITIDRYLDAVNRWANAVAIEGQMRARYSVALALLDEAKGTLLARHQIKVEATSQAVVARDSSRPADAAVVRAASPAPEYRGRLVFGLSPLPVSFAARIDPFYVRIPVGMNALIEIRSIKDTFTHSIGAFW